MSEDWEKYFKPDLSAFEDMQVKSKKMQDTNDCTVKAVAIAGGLEYEQVSRVFNKLGRVQGRSCSWVIIRRACKVLGLEIVQTRKEFARQPNGSKFTPKTIGKRIPQGRWIADCSGHVFAVVDGVVQDWTHGRNHRINRLFLVVDK